MSSDHRRYVVWVNLPLVGSPKANWFWVRIQEWPAAQNRVTVVPAWSQAWGRGLRVRVWWLDLTPKQPKATACICPAVHPPPTGGAVGISLGLSVKYNRRATAENLKKKPADINATLLETLVYMHKQFPLNALKADRTFQLINGRICQKY